MIDDTPPADSAVPPNTQMYFASSYTDTTLAEWLKDPASTDMFDAAFSHAATASALITITVPGVGAFDLVNLIDHTHHYDYVVRRNTDPWEGGGTVALAKPDAFRAVETALRVLGIDRTLHPTPLAYADPYWYAVLMPRPTRHLSRTESGNYLTNDGDGVIREWDSETSDLVRVNRSTPNPGRVI